MGESLYKFMGSQSVGLTCGILIKSLSYPAAGVNEWKRHLSEDSAFTLA